MRVVLAGASNGGGYANVFQTQEPNYNNGGILASVLAELWDFDTRISTDGKGNATPQDFLQELTGNPQHFRGYNQTTDHSPQADFAVTLDDTSWSNYYANVKNVAAEIPPLPPGPYSDTVKSDDQLGAGGLYYRHHLIRDFMFLDAAKNNSVSDLFPEPAWQTTNTYEVQQIAFGIDQNTEAYVLQYTQGPGHHQGTYHLLHDTQEPVDSSPLSFDDSPIGFTALLYELQNPDGTAADVVPNWFGVAVPDGINDFRNVIIYFHPSPGQAGYDVGTPEKPNDGTINDYQHKSGTKGSSTNWKELFAYVERLGKQLAGAITQSSDPSSRLQNQVVIVPFMQLYDDVGILPQYWSFIVKAILDDLYKNQPNFYQPS